MQRFCAQMPIWILRGLLMNSTTYRVLNRPRATALVLIASGVLGVLAACSSDGGNAAPSGPPVINTGGGGSSSGGSHNDAGESSAGGSRAGSGNKAGGSNGGSGGGTVVADGGEGGAGAEGGEAGAGPVLPTCPSTDLGFLNQPSKSQKAAFDNTKRLGPHATLPTLP